MNQPNNAGSCQLSESLADFLIDTRRIQIFDDIDDKASSQTIATLQLFDIQSELPVYIYLNSFGGYTSDGFAIIDQMLLMKCPVFTIVMGCAYSMAAFIAAFGTNGCRFATKHSRIMFHPTSIALDQDYLEQQHKLVDFERKMSATYDKELADRLKLNAAQFKKLCEKGYWIDASMAKKQKIIDGIWTPDMEHKVNDRVRSEGKKGTNTKNLATILKSLSEAIESEEDFVIERE